MTEIANHIVRQVTPLGIVTPLAGKAQVIGSDDGVGSTARFNYPLGVVADGDRLVVVDSYNHALRRISATAVVTRFVGWPVVAGSTDGTLSNARFNYPEDVTVDSDGTIYVADQFNSTIRKISGDTVSTLAGLAGSTNSVDGMGTEARFNHPIGVAARDGVVYVADTGNHTIRKITADGRVSTLAGSPGAPGSANGAGATAHFNGPFRLTVDAARLHPRGGHWEPPYPQDHARWTCNHLGWQGGHCRQRGRRGDPCVFLRARRHRRRCKRERIRGRRR